jgi:hypothetical protein
MPRKLDTHPGFSDGVIKVGIASCHSNRLARFRKRGWAVKESLRFEDRAIPAAIEKAVLTWLSGDLGRSSCLSPDEMDGMSGSNETFSVGDLRAAGVTLDDVVDRIHQEAAKHSDTGVGGTGPEVPAKRAA